MVKSRKEILEINPSFTQFILNLQISFKPPPFEAGDRVDSVSFNLKGDKEGVALLTQENADELNSDRNKVFEKNRDKNPFSKKTELEFIGSHLYKSSKENTTDYLSDISDIIEMIRIELGETSLMILGVENTPWLYQENDYEPVKNALDYLRERIDKKFNGGFLIKESELIEFIPHLFWLTRCNASLPYFFLSLPNSKTYINICKYGVLHFEFYNKNEKDIIINLLTRMQFKEIDNCEDPISFDSFDGRRIKMS